MARPRSLVFAGQDDSSQDYASWYNATVDNPFHYGSAVTADDLVSNTLHWAHGIVVQPGPGNRY